MSGNFETKADVTKRIAAEAEERRSRARAMFQKSVPQEATLQFMVTSEQAGGPAKFANMKGEGIDCPTYIVRVAPLAIEDDKNSVQMEFEESIWITLPLRNLDIEGHTVGNSVTNDAAKTLVGIAPDRVQYVDKGNPTDGWKNDPETKAARSRQEIAVAEVSTDLLSGAYKTVGTMFYGDVKHKKSDKGGYRINSIAATLLDGKEFNAPVEFVPSN
jgi:hypothetical protein